MHSGENRDALGWFFVGGGRGVENSYQLFKSD